jgi:hypothetical protein
VEIARLELADMDATALVHRAALNDALPWLAKLHTPQEDRTYFRNRLFQAAKSGAQLMEMRYLDSSRFVKIGSINSTFCRERNVRASERLYWRSLRPRFLGSMLGRSNVTAELGTFMNAEVSFRSNGQTVKTMRRSRMFCTYGKRGLGDK